MVVGFFSENTNHMSNIATEESACTIKRKPLKRLFNGEREYMFTTQRNIRDYEWTLLEVEELLEGLQELNSDDSSYAANDLELNLITIRPASMSTEELKQMGNPLYDVHDGQQRLVSLSLLIAAMRDCMLRWAREEGQEGDENDSRKLPAYSKELGRAIYPTQPGLKDAARIQVRGSGGKQLDYILSKKDGRLDLPKKRERKKLSLSEQLIIEHYEYFVKSISEMGVKATIQLWRSIQNRTYVLMCIPASLRIARNLVMGLSKGKNLEPVDEFKGMVCFNRIPDESLQDQTLQEWNELAQTVERKNLQSSCLIFAQIYLKRGGRKNGEVELMEAFLDEYLAQFGGRTGVQFFHERIVPAAKTLKDFREGNISIQQVGSSPVPSLSFLRKAAAQIESMEILTLFYLLQSEYHLKHAENGVIQDDVALLEDLFKLERLALWMMVAKPKKSVRLQRCFAIIAAQRLQDSPPLLLDLTEAEKKQTLDGLREGSIGSSPSAAKAILERLNEFTLLRDSQGRVDTTDLHLEHVLPQKYQDVPEWNSFWSNEEDATEWMHRLGNLALLNQSMNAKIKNGQFNDKKEALRSSPYPLTRHIADYHIWNAEMVQRNHEEVLGLAKNTWNL